MSQQANPIQGNDNMNTRLTIRPVLTAAALAVAIGMTSVVSVAGAGGVGAQGATMGAAGPYQPSPFVDYDNTYRTRAHAKLLCHLTARGAGSNLFNGAPRKSSEYGRGIEFPPANKGAATTFAHR